MAAPAHAWAVVATGGQYPGAKRFGRGHHFGTERRQARILGDQYSYSPRQLAHRDDLEFIRQSDQRRH